MKWLFAQINLRGTKINYLNPLYRFQHLGALNRFRLLLSDGMSAVMLSLANGGLVGKEAFVAFVRFRAEDNSLILPPYEGFSHSPRGAAYFLVSGGEAAAPVATTHSFMPPLGAAIMEIELRPEKFGDRPRLAAEPCLINGDRPRAAEIANPNTHRLSVSDNISAVTMTLANGGSKEKKAFVASVGFFDGNGNLIQSPYEGFAQSSTFGAYFYVEGGSAAAPISTTHVFTPPAEAATMEIELRPWRFKGQAQFANNPATVPKKTYKLPPQQHQQAREKVDTLSANLASATIGTQIIRYIDSGKITIVGIVGDELHNAWRERIADPALSFDGYDNDWNRIAPTHLVVEVDQLPQRFGWETALTLRDPATTVEMAIMLQKARKAGIATVLISPVESYRFPLLSRVVDFFDLALEPSDTAIEHLLLNN